MAAVIQRASDHSLLVVFGHEISLEHHQQVHALTEKLLRQRPEFILNIHPAYSSVLVRFDPLQASAAEVKSYLTSLLDEANEGPAIASRRVEIPVCYGGELGPDLEYVAKHNSLAPEEVIAIHANATYRVYFIGFTPGFAYLGGMSSRIATPRLDTPRVKVPAGSVAIGGNQTGVYPLSTPGGWRIIGRTPLLMFSPHREEPSLLRLGDEVRFRGISREEFEEMRGLT